MIRSVIPIFLAAALPLQAAPAPPPDEFPRVIIEKITVDGVSYPIPAGDLLELPPGSRDIRFDVTLLNTPALASKGVRSHLSGLDADWVEEKGDAMSLQAQFLDAKGRVTGGSHVALSGATLGFGADWRDVFLFPRREPLFVPAGSETLRLIFSSGNPATTGRAVIDALTLNLPTGSSDPTRDLWKNTEFNKRVDEVKGPMGTPLGWRRAGSNPSIAQMVDTKTAPSLGLDDDDPEGYAEWISDLPLESSVKAGDTLTLSWKCAWNVADGNHRVITRRIPQSGEYVMRVAALLYNPDSNGAGTSLSLNIRVNSYLWQRPWFWPSIAAGVVALFGGGGWYLWHQRMRQKLERVMAQNALEQDRTRIARDMHDDVGARLTRMALITAMAGRDLDLADNAAAKAHLDHLSGLTREVVVAMDEIVWAVDPGNDTLEHLGAYLCRFAEEFLNGSPVRCRFGISPVLPALPISAEARHHLFLAVKESLNNTLKHAGPCEVRLEMNIADGHLCIDVTDTGSGFPVSQPAPGNGLRNMERRLEDIGGTCTLTSDFNGTRVAVRWPLPETP